jgi:DNA replication protein DnaC
MRHHDRQNDVSPERLERIRSMDTDEDFGTVLGRARAKARGEIYKPEIHDPQDAPTNIEGRVKPEHMAKLDELLDRFMARPRTGGYSRPEPDRPAVPEMPREMALAAINRRIGWYVPPRFQDKTLDNFTPHSESQRAALEMVREWVEMVKAGEGPTLALLGAVGTGKSHLLYAATRAVNEHIDAANPSGIHMAAWGWYDLALMLKEAKYNPDAEVQTEAQRKRERLFAAKAFGIDEIRPTSGTDFDVTELSQLMVRAYSHKQGVIVTSNAVDRKLIEIIGQAAASRLTPIIVTGPDMRKPENRHLRAV